MGLARGGGPSAAAALFAGPGEVRALGRTLDWGATPLGWPHTWSPALRIATHAMLDAPHPICLWSGPEYALVYNDAYRRILAAKHPAALGQPGSIVWAEIWAELAAQFAQVWGGGAPVYGEDARFVMARLEGGETEDAWFSYSLSALRDEGGEIVAILNISPETTARVRAEQALEERTAEAERARAAADAASRRLAFLAQASERLASSLDYETTLDEILALAVPTVADWALYTVDGGDGTLRVMGSRHADREKEAFIAESVRRYPIRADEPAGAARVLRTGEPELIAEVPDALLEAVARDPDHLVILRAVGFKSLMTVPVRAQGRTLGALGFVTGASGRLYGPEDLAFAQELARRAATALDHAYLYAEAEAARREAERERERAVGILETMADAHFVLDADLRFVSVNAASERNLDRSRGQLLGRTLTEVFPGTAGTIFEQSYRRVIDEGVALQFSGEYADDTIDIVPEVDAYPTPDGGVAVFWRDISARKRAEAALVASERQFRTLADAIPTLAWTARADGYIDWYNARWYEYTGTTPMQMEGWGWQSVHDPVALPDILERWRASIASGTPFEMTLPLRGADGRFRRFLTRVMPVRDASERVVRWFGTNTDVEVERAAREAAQAAHLEAESQRAKAEAANAAKSQFLSTMSHELRTPLNAIGGYAELMMMGLRGELTGEQRQDLERIRLANQHLMSLVTDILNFTRVDAGQIEFRPADVELASVVGDLESLLGPQMRAKEITFSHDGCAADTPDRPHLVRADPEKLRQILLNLLGNAVKFTDTGGRIAIVCSTDEDARAISVRVRDTGRGIPADQLERIFEPFVQVDRHRTHESQQGVGLGLAISRELARRMGGELTAESEVGAGSTFTLTLPRA